MNLTEKQKEQLTVALRRRYSQPLPEQPSFRKGRLYRKYRKKILAENARQEEKLTKEKYRLKEKALKRKYRLKNKKKR